MIRVRGCIVLFPCSFPAQYGSDTLMIWSAYKGHGDAVMFLLKQGADINARNKVQMCAGV